MKLVVQIPCLNEEETLPLVFEKMPRHIPGIESIEYLVIDDGSRDRTLDVATELGVQHLVRHVGNMGLGQSFRDGIHKALEVGADILVNTDGDNQYPSEMIPELVQPIIEGRADIVIADRQTHTIEHFSPLKKVLQRVGSRVVSQVAGVDLPDAASGFRAYSREALLRLNPMARFSYCMETIIQAGNKRLAITSVPVKTNPKTRDSRLFRNMREHVLKSGLIILRAYIMYRPMMLFMTISGLLFAAALIPFVRFLVLLYFGHDSAGVHHVQSLIAGSVLLIASVLFFALGIIADLIRINRALTEEALEQQKRDRFDPPSLSQVPVPEAGMRLVTGT